MSVDRHRVGLVVVSHSARIAEGVVELAGQMADGVTIAAAGGLPTGPDGSGGGIGTDFQLVQAGIEAADSGDGAVILCDLGSAVLTASTALDFLEPEQQARIRLADAPIVEGAVAAAVAAAAGDPVDAVLAAAEGRSFEPAAEGRSFEPAAQEGGSVERTVELVNRDGLHARPAAEFVKLAAGFDAAVTVQGKDARSLLAVLSLGLTHGDELLLSAAGPQAREAVDALAALVEGGFGEA